MFWKGFHNWWKWQISHISSVPKSFQLEWDEIIWKGKEYWKKTSSIVQIIEIGLKLNVDSKVLQKLTGSRLNIWFIGHGMDNASFASHSSSHLINVLSFHVSCTWSWYWGNLSRRRGFLLKPILGIDSRDYWSIGNEVGISSSMNQGAQHGYCGNEW